MHRLSLADFNPEAFAPENLVPTHSRGLEAAPKADDDGDWGKTRGGEGPDSAGSTRAARPPARADGDVDWRASQPEHREIAPGGGKQQDAADDNWRGTQRGEADGDTDWRGSAAGPVSRVDEEKPDAASERVHAGANRGQADGDVDWRGSAAGPVSRPEEKAPDAASERVHAGANRGLADGDTDWRGSAAGPVSRPEEKAPEEQTTWRGSARGAADRGGWSRDQCAPVSRPAAQMSAAPERGNADRGGWSRDQCAPVSRPSAQMGAAPERGGSWRGGDGPTSRAAPQACMFFAKGACQRGDNCRYSHDPLVINDFLKQQAENLQGSGRLQQGDGAPVRMTRQPLKLQGKTVSNNVSAPSSPVGTPTKRNDAVADKPAAAAKVVAVDDDGFEVVTKGRKARA